MIEKNGPKEFGHPTLILILLVSFASVFNVGNLIHELGHLVFLSVHGGYSTELVFHPFLPTHVTSNPVPPPGWSDMGGWLFNIGFGSLATFLTWRSSKMYVFPLQIWGPLALIVEGFNILLSPLSPGSDGERFAIFLHISVLIFSVIGLFLMIVGLVLYGLALQKLGIGNNRSFLNRVMILILGNSLYFFMAYVFLILFAPSADFNRINVNLIAVVLVSILTIITQKLIYD